MDRLTFIAKLAEALAWPFTVVLIVLLLRGQLRSLIPRLRNLKYKDLQAEFAEQLAAADKAADVAKLPRSRAESTRQSRKDRPSLSSWGRLGETFGIALAPADAIDRAWKQLVSEMQEALKRQNVDVSLSEEVIERELISRNLLPHNAIGLIRSLREARDKAVHLGDLGVDAGQAESFVQLVDRLVVALRGPAFPS